MRTNRKMKLRAEEVARDKEAGWTKMDPKSAAHKKIAASVAAMTASVKEERITVRFNATDLKLLKQKADSKGVGYQTLLGSIMHEYLTGQLVNIDDAKLALSALMKK